MKNNCSFGRLWCITPTQTWNNNKPAVFHIQVQLRWILKYIWGPIQNSFSQHPYAWGKKWANASVHSLVWTPCISYLDECSPWNTHRWYIASSISTLSKAPHVPFPPTVRVWNLKSSTSVIALLFGAPRCWGSIMTITTVAQGWQSYKTGVFMGGGEAPRAKLSEERRQDSDLTMELGASYWVSQMSHQVCSATLLHASPDRLFVPWKYSSFSSTLPSLWDFSLPLCVPLQLARWAKLRLAITAHPPGSEGKRLVDLRMRDWLRLSLLMDGFLGTCLSGRGSRRRRVRLAISFWICFFIEAFLSFIQNWSCYYQLVSFFQICLASTLLDEAQHRKDPSQLRAQFTKEKLRHFPFALSYCCHTCRACPD